MGRRVNTPFVAIIGLIGVMGLGTIVAGPSIKRRFFSPPIASQVAALRTTADELVKQGQFSDAAETINLACRKDPANKDLCLQRGDILMLVAEDGDAALIDAARRSWENALTIDHACKPALGRLFDSCVEELDARPSPGVCAHLRDVASRLLKYDPSDARARAYIEIATIQEWVTGLPMKSEQSSQAIAHLAEIQKSNPSAGDILFHLVRGMAFQATNDAGHFREVQAGQTREACRRLLANATTTYPRDSRLNFRAFQGYVILIDAEHDAREMKKDRIAADTAIHRAREVLAGDDPHFADYQYVASEWARRNGRLDESEKILRAFYDTQKTDQHARLALARILAYTGDSAKRDEAIAILEQPVLPTRQSPLAATSLAELKGGTLLELTSLRVAQIGSIEPARRAALLAQIEGAYATIQTDASADAIPVLRLGGLIAQIKGQNVQAVQLLSRAMTLLDHSESQGEIKFDLMYQLATAERLTGQDGSAKRLLVPIVEHFASFAPARIQLAQLYLAESNADEAARHIGILATQKPTDLEVVRLRTALAQLQGDSTAVKNLGASLPASNNPTKQTRCGNDEPILKELRDAYSALQASKFPQALEHARTADMIRPNDPTVLDLFFNIYLTQQDWKPAQQTVERLASINADQADGTIYRWKLCMARRQFADAIALANGLAIARENFAQSWIILAQAYQANGQFDEAIQKYQAALERQTTNIDVYRGLAECYQQLSQPDRAVDAIRQGISLFPADQRLQAIRFAAQYYESAGQFAISEQLYRQCVGMTPDDPTTLNNYAYLLAEDLHRPAEARQYSQRAYDIGLKLRHLDPMIADTHGWVLTLCGGSDANEGLTILISLAKDHTDSLDARYHLAMAYIMQNRPTDAIDELTATMNQITAMETNHLNFDPRMKANVQQAMTKARQAMASVKEY